MNYQLCQNDIPENDMALFSEYRSPKYAQGQKQRNRNVYIIPVIAREKEGDTRLKYRTNTNYIGVTEKNEGTKVTYCLKFKPWLSIGKTLEMCEFCNLFCLM